MVSQDKASFLHICVFLLLVLVLHPIHVAQAQDHSVPSDLRGESLPFLPYLEFMIDESGTMDIEAIALQNQNLPFSPLKPLDINQKTGTFWLRFTIAPLTEGARPVEWLLSLGESLPGDPILFVPEIQPQTGMTQWETQLITDRHIFKLPEATSEPKTCYIRIAGPPGLWFAPMLRSPNNAANNWGSLARPACVLGLFVIMLLCILRSFSEHGQWRIWTALYVCGALTSGYLGLPSMEKGHITFSHFASALAPGITLMLLPHVARHLMRSSSYSRFVDAQLILITLVGAAVTLLPLVPGLSWTARFLEIWPLGTIFFIPTALCALFLGLPGSQRFMLVCIIPPLFTAAGILGLISGFPADTLAACPLCGVALSALMLVAAQNPPQPNKKNNQETQDPSLVLHDDFSDPNLLINTEENMPPKKAVKQELDLSDLDFTENKTPSEPALDIHLSAPESEVVQQTTSNPEQENDQKEIAAKIEKDLEQPIPFNLEEQEESSEKDDVAQTIAPEYSEPKEEIFDLELLMRDIYDRVCNDSKNSLQAIGWYMPPNLSLFYRGTSYLKTVLYELVDSTAKSMNKGLLHFTVQQMPKEKDPGYLLFTVRDSEGGPDKRSFESIKKAWELATILNGSFTLESTTNGCVMKLAVHLSYIAEEKTQPQPLIIVCSEDSIIRYTIHKMLKNVPARIFDARNLISAQVLQQGDHAVLIIAHDTIATPEAAPILADIKKIELSKGLPQTRTLAITKTDTNWTALGIAGFTYALLEPIDPDKLTATALKVIQEYQEELNKLASQKSLPNFFGEQAVPTKLESLLDIEENLTELIQKEQTQYTKSPNQELTSEHNLVASKTNVADSLKQQSLSEPTASISTPLSYTSDLHQNTTTQFQSVSNELKSNLDDEEWVGEPMPVPKTNENKAMPEEELPELKITSQDPTQPQLGFNDTWVDDWVGEPIPVIKNATRANESNTKIADISQGTVLQSVQTPSNAATKEEESTPSKLPDPTIQALISRLNSAMNDAKTAFESKQPLRVAEAAHRIAHDCDAFSFRIAARVAYCVEQAGKAGDMHALENLLPELTNQIERNSIALEQNK